MYDGGAIMDVNVDASKMLAFDYIHSVCSQFRPPWSHREVAIIISCTSHFPHSLDATLPPRPQTPPPKKEEAEQQPAPPSPQPKEDEPETMEEVRVGLHSVEGSGVGVMCHSGVWSGVMCIVGQGVMDSTI